MSGPDDSGATGKDGPVSSELPELLAARRRKLERLRAAGVEPFPHAFPDVTPIGELRARFADLEAGAETDATYRVTDIPAHPGQVLDDLRALGAIG